MGARRRGVRALGGGQPVASPPRRRATTEPTRGRRTATSGSTCRTTAASRSARTPKPTRRRWSTPRRTSPFPTRPRSATRWATARSSRGARARHRSGRRSASSAGRESPSSSSAAARTRGASPSDRRAPRLRGAERSRPQPGALPLRGRRDDGERRSHAVQESGEAWMSGTTWDGRAAIRLSVSGWRTTDAGHRSRPSRRSPPLRRVSDEVDAAAVPGFSPRRAPRPRARRSPRTTDGSASVVVSPSGRCSATSRSSRRMIFPERVFGSSGVKTMFAGLAIAPIFTATWFRSSSSISTEPVVAALERHVGDDRLTGGRVRAPAHRRLGDALVVDERRLDLDRRDPVPRDVHHVVDAAEQPEVAVLVDPRAVAGEVEAREALPVRRPEPRVVAEDAARHRRPRPLEDEVAAALLDLLALLVDDRRGDPGERLRRRAGLRRRHSGQRRDEDHPGLGLPPRVDDRARASPPMCSWYQIHASGLIGSPTEPSSRSDAEIVLLAACSGPPLHVRADRGRRGVEDRDAVALDDRPPARLVREVGRPLVEHRGRRVAERPVDDVAVAGDPADVGRAPVDVASRASGRRRSGASSRRRRGSRPSCARSPSASRSCRTCTSRNSRSSLSIGSHGHVAGSSETSSSWYQRSRPSVIGTSFPVRRTTRHEWTPRRGRHRLVGGALERHRRPAAPGLVLRDEHLAAHVDHAIRERVGREAAEDDRVRRAEPGAREHRDRELGDHPHVDRDRRPLARRRAPGARSPCGRPPAGGRRT